MIRMTAAAFAVTVCCVMAAVPAAAADQDGATLTVAATETVVPTVDVPNRSLQLAPYGVSRGSALPALYVSLAALQVVDGYTTMTGLARGAREGNSLMSGVVRNPAAMWAVKGGVTVVSIYVSERLWKQGHRGRAITTMLVSNGLMAMVAARNASTLRAQR